MFFDTQSEQGEHRMLTRCCFDNSSRLVAGRLPYNYALLKQHFSNLQHSPYSGYVSERSTLRYAPSPLPYSILYSIHSSHSKLINVEKTVWGFEGIIKVNLMAS